MEARKMASHQFIDRPMGILGLFFFKGLLNFLTKEETLTQVRWLLTSEVNNYLFITDYFQYKIGIAFQLALHTSQNSQNKWTKIPANLPDQFSRSGQIFLHWAAATLKGLVRCFMIGLEILQLTTYRRLLQMPIDFIPNCNKL